jgi:hypothetical protein
VVEPNNSLYKRGFHPEKGAGARFAARKQKDTIPAGVQEDGGHWI